ncbi:MAG TPA: hypothetical protein VM100_14415 [Longimicrobiales bacterium]|nr:hypothetical protein [Longimicrobiales bacterium]
MRKVLLALVAASISTNALAQEQHDHKTASSGVGSVHFPVSCNAEAQRRMDRAVAMLHSFWFGEAHKTFESVVQADPGCGVAYWGAAVTQFGNPMGGGTGAPAQQLGWTEAQKAMQIGARSARDSAYIAAASALFKDNDKLNNRERMKLYEQALGDVVRRFPNDTEGQILHAIMMVATAPPTDMTFSQQKKAADILTPMYLKQPNHPGLAHYIIHAFDAPPLAHYALQAARKYAQIAPDAPHALHMPSHTFTRLGYWDESIVTNRKSMNLEPTPAAKSHAADYMVYAYLQKGVDDSALVVVRELTQGDAGAAYATGTTLSYNMLALTARYHLEREDWKSAATLPVVVSQPQNEAVTHFARGLGAARSGDIGGARVEINELNKMVEKLITAKDPYWPITIDAQRMAVEAWTAHLEGDHGTALKLAKEAADKEETVEKHPVTPGPLIPARELYGDILMLHGKPVEALAAYEKTMEREPNRTRTLYQAVKAAHAVGNHAAAAKYGAQLKKIVSSKATRFQDM